MVGAQVAAPPLFVDGKGVELKFPSASADTMSSDLMAWRGWGYLKGEKPAGESMFRVGYDWSAVQSALKPKNSTAAPWRERIVIFTHAENDARDADGVLQIGRHVMESLALKQTEEALARFTVWVNTLSDGRIAFVPEVTVEAEPMRDDKFGAEFAKKYFGPRINGGGYESEDKVFRGPYHGGMYILPGSQSRLTDLSLVTGAPFVGVVQVSPDGLEEQLLAAFKKEAEYRLASRVFSGSETDAWAEACDLTPLSTAAKLDRLSKAQPFSFSFAGPSKPAPVASYKTTFTEVTLVADPQKGQVLHIAEKGVGRPGGFELPVRGDGAPLVAVKDSPSLTIQLKSTAKDPIGVIVTGKDGKALEYSIGVSRPRLADAPSATVAFIPFTNDGAWQKVSLDLRGLGPDGLVKSVAIAPTSASVANGRIQAEPIEADFDGFEFTNDAPSPQFAAAVPNATSTDPEERALFAAKATETSAPLLALVADPAELVRFNACEAYTRIKDAAAMPALTKDFDDLDPSIGAQALRAIMNQGGDPAFAAMHRAVYHAVTPYARETAARLLATTKDPKYGDDIVSLLADRSWHCRLASVEALSNVPGKEAAIRRMAFIDQVDPQIKLAVTVTCDPADEYQMRKLLWSAVNEPSDMVRAESDIKLIQSPDANFRTEGFKGVKDDSRATRLAVLDYMQRNPNENNRAALRLAVADRSPEIRAAALRGFAKLEKGAEPDEIANVMEDKDPEVQLALIALAKTKGLKLSDATKAAMAASPDERVRNAAKDLGGN